jgi:predicted DNA-binding transcriptional regulator AlpA
MSDPAIRLTPDPGSASTVEQIHARPEAASRPARAELEPLLVDADQSAALCGVHVSTWYRWLAARRVPAPIRLSRGVVRWRIEELKEWISAGCPDRRTFEARRAAGNGRR